VIVGDATNATMDAFTLRQYLRPLGANVGDAVVAIDDIPDAWRTLLFHGGVGYMANSGLELAAPPSCCQPLYLQHGWRETRM
jgi:hypothetical protein